MRTLLLPVACASLCLAVGLAAQEKPQAHPPGNRSAADQALVAFRSDGLESALEVVEGSGEDPFFVVAELLARWEDQGAEELARQIAERNGEDGLEQIVGTWAAGLVDRDRESRLQDSYARIVALSDARRWKDVLSVGDEISEDLAAADRSLHVPLVLIRLATAATNLNEHASAIEFLARAASAGAALGWQVMEITAKGKQSTSLQSLGRMQEALEMAQSAVRQAEELESPRMLSEALRREALVLQKLGRVEDAEAAYQSALELAREADWEEVVPLLLKDIGFFHMHHGNMVEAIGFFESCIEKCESSDDRNCLALAFNGLGLTYLQQEQHARALECMERALGIFEEIGNRQSVGEVELALGQLHYTLHDTEESLLHLERALAVAKEVNARQFEAYTLLAISSTLELQGKVEAALRIQEEALPILEHSGDRQAAAIARFNLGSTYLRLERLEEAEKCLERAVQEQRELGHARNEMVALSTWGDVLQLQQRAEEAMETYLEARERCRMLGLAQDESVIEHKIGVLAFRNQDYAEALRALRAALDLILRLGRGMSEQERLGLRAKTEARARELLHVAAHTFDSDASDEVKDQAGVQGYEAMERSRGLLLAEGLVNRTEWMEARLPAELVEEEAAARGQIRSAMRELIEAGSSRSLDRDSLARIRLRLEEAYRRHEDAMARIGRENRRGLDALFAEPVSWNELQHLLPDRTAYVAYELMPRERFVMSLATKQHAGLVVAGGSDALVEAVERYLRQVTIPDAEPDAELCNELYSALLGNLAPYLEGIDRLLLSPSGPLTFLPFEALGRKKQDGSVERAIDRYEISYVPSGTVYAALVQDFAETPATSGLLALGDPVYPSERNGGEAPPLADFERGLGDLQRLVGSGEEVRAIGALFPENERSLLLREAATRALLLSELEQTDHRLLAVHFACHGYVDEVRPALGGLVLGGGEILSIADIYRMDIPAELAVLSACETGRGKLADGEGVLGLTRAFFLSGVPRVVVANWKVADEDARALMVAFYRKMVLEGMAPSAALRAAKLERIRSDPSRSPYHWAGFNLWGRQD